MHFSTPITILLSLTGALATPVINKRAVGTSAPVLKVQTYDEFSVSNGTSGNALAEVNAKFPVCSTSSFPFLPLTRPLRSTKTTSPALPLPTFK